MSSAPSSAAAAAYAGTPGVTSHGTPCRVEPLGLLVQGGVDRRIAGAQAYDLEPGGVGLDDARGDLVEVEVLRVDELRAVGAVVEHRVVDVGAGVARRRRRR